MPASELEHNRASPPATVTVQDFGVSAPDVRDGDKSAARVADTAWLLSLGDNNCRPSVLTYARGAVGATNPAATPPGARGVIEEPYGVQLRFHERRALRTLVLSEFAVGERAELRCSDNDDRERTLLQIDITTAETDLFEQTKRGFDIYDLRAVNGSSFGLVGFVAVLGDSSSAAPLQHAPARESMDQWTTLEPTKSQSQTLQISSNEPALSFSVSQSVQLSPPLPSIAVIGITFVAVVVVVWLK